MINEKPKDYKVKKYSVGSNERVLKIEGGRDLNTKVNVGTMLQLLGGSIYKSNVSAFREQLVNAISHGCISVNQKLKEGEQKAFVDVLFDFNKRRVEITDVNGMGMPWKLMDEVVTSLGDSGNQDRTRSGQFGCGMFSFIRMADTTIIETWSKETDEHYAYISEGSKWYEIENRDLEYTGTKIMITFKPDVDMLELVESTKTISDFQPVDVFLKVQGWQKKDTKKESVANYGRQEASDNEWFKGNGLYELGNNKMQDDLITHVGRDGKLESEDVITLEDKNNDIEIFFTLPKTPFDGYSSFTDQYLCNIPIGGGIAFDGLTSLRVNFTNEKTWSPPVDRDRLTDESMKMAEKCVNNMITEWLSKIKINTIDDFKNHDYSDIVNSRRLDEWLNQGTLNVIHALRRQYRVWKYDPSGDNYTAETLRKNKSSSQVYLSEILEYNEGNLFSSEKIDKRLYNVYAEHFPKGFMFILGSPYELTVMERTETEREALSRGEDVVDNHSLAGYLKNSCGIDELPDAVVYKKINNLKLTVNRSGGGGRNRAAGLQVAARTFNYYGRTDIFEYSGKKVNKSLIWLQGKSYLDVKNTFQSQYYGGRDDFTFRGLQGALLSNGGSRNAVNNTLLDKFWEDHKFIVKQIPKNVQESVTEFNFFRDSIFSSKVFINSKGERVSLIEMIRLVHPELKQLNQPIEGGVKMYKLKVVTTKEIFDSYNDIEGEKDYENLFYLDVDFREIGTPEMKALANLYVAILMTNFQLSNCFSHGYSSSNVISSGIAIDFSEEDIRREIFSKNSLYDNFKYMDQSAPNDFLETFQSFTDKYGSHFSQEVIDLTCYLLSRKHSGLNSVYMYHNNRLTTTPTIDIDPVFKVIKGDMVVRNNDWKYAKPMKKYVEARHKLDIHQMYYYTAKMIERVIEDQIKNIGKYCIRHETCDDGMYMNNTHVPMMDESGEFKQTLTDTIEEMKDLVIGRKPVEIYCDDGEIKTRNYEKEDMNCLLKEKRKTLDNEGSSKYSGVRKDTFLDTYGRVEDIIFLTSIVVRSLEGRNSYSNSDTISKFFKILTKVYNLDHLVNQGMTKMILSEQNEYMHHLKEGDVVFRRYGLGVEDMKLFGGEYWRDKTEVIKIKVVKVPSCTKWVQNLDDSEIILHVTFNNDPLLLAHFIPTVLNTTDRSNLLGSNTDVPSTTSSYSPNIIEKNNEKVTMELVINRNLQ